MQAAYAVHMTCIQASTPCKQAACQLHYASNVNTSIATHVFIVGVDAEQYGVESTPCMQPACSLHYARKIIRE